jgi:hypothetical protein
MRSLHSLSAYVIGVLVVWAVIFVLGYFVHGPTPGHPMLYVFGGFLLGMLSMHIATRVYRREPPGRWYFIQRGQEPVVV